MYQKDSLALMALQKNQAIAELQDCNYVTSRYGLTLTQTQINNLVEQRFEVLKSTGRIEFGQGILKKLAEAFCDSVYITQENYEEILASLQELFYYFKNESLDELSDDELIDYMRRAFDGPCQGSIDYLGETALEELCRGTRFGSDIDDDVYYEDDEDYDSDRDMYDD